jgi:hypothetical protein
MRSLVLALLLSAGGCGGAPAQSWETTTLPSAVLPPGDERLLCSYVPATGVERFLSRLEVELSAGSHHLIVVRVDERKLAGATQPGDLSDCSEAETPPDALDGLLPAAQERYSRFAMPDGVAMKMEPYHGLQFRAHYLNSTGAALPTQVIWRAGYVEPPAVREVAGMLFFVNGALHVPPGLSTATRRCGAPQDLVLVAAMGHMHMHGLTFDAVVGERGIYHTDNWDQPGVTTFAAPGMPVSAGTEIAWTCTYDNRTGAPLRFGGSASANEMCTLVAIYYPAAGGQTLGC